MENSTIGQTGILATEILAPIEYKIIKKAIKQTMKFLFSFLILMTINQICNAQEWTQLGLGGGGQCRAIYSEYFANPTPHYEVYIGSDVAGVWRALI